MIDIVCKQVNIKNIRIERYRMGVYGCGTQWSVFFIFENLRCGGGEVGLGLDIFSDVFIGVVKGGFFL